MAIKGLLKEIQSGRDKLSTITDSITAAKQKIDSAAGQINGASLGGISLGLEPSNFGTAMFDNIVPTDSANQLGNIVKGITPAIAPSLNSSKKSNAFGNSLVYPETLNNIELNPAHINFQFYKRVDNNTRLVKSTSIHLPMPDNVQNPSTVNWDQENFGMIGDAVVKGLQSVAKGGNTSDMANAAQAKIEAMAERIKSLAFYSGVSNTISGAGGANISAEALSGAVSGKTPNPYATVLFRGVDFRTFSFDFILVPFSESDCLLIDKIVNKFREHAYPDFAGDKMFFTYPDECQITYMWESSNNRWLNNFKRAVCTKIDINFTPNGQWSSLRNGFPNQVRISTTWKEIEVITKQDIKNRDLGGQRS